MHGANAPIVPVPDSPAKLSCAHLGTAEDDLWRSEGVGERKKEERKGSNNSKWHPPLLLFFAFPILLRIAQRPRRKRSQDNKWIGGNGGRTWVK